MSEVGQEIKRLRQAKGWTQGQLAVYAGSSQPTVNLIETGKRNPSAATLEKLARALEVEVADLFPKGARRSPSELTFNHVLAEERRTLDYRACADALDRFSTHWQTRLNFDDLDKRSTWEFGIAAEYFILPVIEQILDAELAELKEKGGGSPARGGPSTYPDSVMWDAMWRFMDVFVAVATAYEKKFGEPARDECGVVYLDEIRKVKERLERKAGVA